MKIALCAGHTVNAKGAENHKHGVNEHDEAKVVVRHMTDLLEDAGHSVHVFTGTLTRKVANINAGNFDLAMDVHFNAGGGHGCEVLYVPGNVFRGSQAARMSEAIAECIDVRDRGAKEGWYKMRKGGDKDYFLQRTNCPAFIPEPIFIDNDAEVEKFLINGGRRMLAHAIAEGIREVFE